MNRVRGVRSPVGDRTFLGRQGLHDAAQPREHGQSAVLQFLDLQLFQVTRFGQAQRVESTTRGDITRDESVVKRVGRQASSVRFGTANQDGFDDQNVPEGRVARAFRRQRGDGARELVRDGGAVIRGAQGTRGEPRDTGAVLGSPGAGDAQLGPSAVDDFTLGVLFVAKRDDRGFAPARVGTEFRVQIRRRQRTEGGDLGLLLRGRRGRFRASRGDLFVNRLLLEDRFLGDFRAGESCREGHLFYFVVCFACAKRTGGRAFVRDCLSARGVGDSCVSKTRVCVYDEIGKKIYSVVFERRRYALRGKKARL